MSLPLERKRGLELRGKGRERGEEGKGRTVHTGDSISLVVASF